MRPPSVFNKMKLKHRESNFSDEQSTSAATNKINRGLGYDYTEKSPRLPGIKSHSNRVGMDSELSKYGGSPKRVEEYHDHQVHVARTEF